MGKRSKPNESISQEDDGNEVHKVEKEVTVAAATAGHVSLEESERKSKKRRRKDTVTVEMPVDEAEKKKVIKLKKQKEESESEPKAGNNMGSVPESDKRIKGRRKKKRADPTSGDEMALPKRKKLSKVVDPTKDKSLSEQGLRALTYAYSQHCNPESWKFNKARQNWLTRNVWSSDAIPDEHMPLVTWYLKSIKGGIRDALVRTCQSYLSAPRVQSEDKAITDGLARPEDASAPLFGLPPETLTNNGQEIRRSRAQILLEALENS